MFAVKNKDLMKTKCRCEYLVNKKCQNDFVWNYSNCEFEFTKVSKLISEEEFEEIIDDITQNKTVSITKYIENCKPFVASSLLFVSVSVILTGNMIYFYCKSKNRDVLPFTVCTRKDCTKRDT